MDWYKDKIGKTFRVCSHDYRNYIVTDKKSNGKYIVKADCEVIEK